uniref:TF-B3 domain-containing protein n=1 Tax=Kalanchoe fedtschenkoi TaxID=63787 RepID=A0A7N0V587_KALFE
MADEERSQFPTGPHFLQPVTSDLATNFLIPADFCKYLEGQRGEAAELRSRRRRRPWPVRIVGRRIVDGWEEFVRENELHVGEILVFRYDGGMCFDVTVFGPSACEKEFPPLATSPAAADENLELEETAAIRGDGLNCPPQAGTDSYVGTMKPSYLRSLFFPVPFILDNQLKKARSGIVVRDEKGKSWPVKLGFKKWGNAVYTRDGWYSFIKETGIREGEDFEVRVISQGRKPVLTFRRISNEENSRVSEFENRQKADQVSEPKIEPIMRQMADQAREPEMEPMPKPANRQEAEEVRVPETEWVATPAKNQKTIEVPVPETEWVATSAKRHKVQGHTLTEQKTDSPRAVRCTYFYATSTWPMIERSRLVVGVEFARANDLINKCGSIILKNQKGEPWAATLKYTKKKTQDSYYISAGWKEFALSNGLGVGCQFKLEIEQPESDTLTFKLSECLPGKLRVGDSA